LYIKTHLKTGLKYFGKTTKNPYKYKGSGKYWLRHLKLHGNEVYTDVVLSTSDEVFCKAYATLFSEVNDIVRSEGWANLRIENGFDGAPVGTKGHSFSSDELSKISSSAKSMWADASASAKIREAQKASWTSQRREAQSKISKLAWTEERRKRHSERIRQLREERGAAWPSCSGVPKSEAHRKKISEAHKARKVKQ